MPHNRHSSRNAGLRPVPAGAADAAPAAERSHGRPWPTRTGPLPAGTARLRILATSDVHAHLLSHDYFANRPLFGRGLEQTAALIAHARREEPQALLLDNGDFLQGTALGDLATLGTMRRRHPVITAFNTLRYDAVALGNHEFDYGTAFLEQALKGARFPVLSANILLRAGPDPCRDVTFAAPYALVRRTLAGAGGERAEVVVGILGLTPPSVTRWNRRQLQGRVIARPMAEAARAWVPAMRAAGADVVICLAHAGAVPDEAADDAGAGAIARIEGVDVVIAGHSHRVHPPPASRRRSAAGRGASPPSSSPALPDRISASWTCGLSASAAAGASARPRHRRRACPNMSRG